MKRLDPASGTPTVLPLPETVGSIAFRERGGLLAATKSGIHFFDPVAGTLAAAARPENHLPDNRFNDGRCDRAGRFWAGTMSDVRREPCGSLYRLDANLECTRLRNSIIIPNGLAWSPDGRSMYFADTNRSTIWAWDYDPASGAASGERVFADTGAGRPDGSCVDADGCLWNAEYGGWRLVRYSPAGKVDRVVELPVANPTCCCFGGGRFDDASARAGACWNVPRMGRGLAAGDLDNDGRVDLLLVSQNQPLAYFHNGTDRPGHALTLRLEGRESNRDGVGAQVRVTAGGRTVVADRFGGGSYLSSSDPRLNFGLGDARRADLIEVLWPSGRTDRHSGLAADAGYLLREGASLPLPLPGFARSVPRPPR